MNDALQYDVRDPQGTVYGPADVNLLRQWVAEGRIVPGMSIAPRDTDEWSEVSTHPALADCFSDGSLLPPAAPGPSTPPAEAMAGQPAPPDSAPPAGPQPSDAGPLAYTPDTRNTNTLAVLSLVAGIVGLSGAPVSCFCACLGGPVSIAAAVAAVMIGIVALRQIDAKPDLFRGRGLAVAGIVLGIVALLLAVLSVLAHALILVQQH